MYQEIAAEYGPLVVVFSPEERPRSLDLNLWNLAHNGYFLMRKSNNTSCSFFFRLTDWLFADTTWDDTGEFITPGYRYAKEVVGMLLFRKMNATNTTTEPRFCNATRVKPIVEDIPYHDRKFHLPKSHNVYIHTHSPSIEVIFAFFKVEYNQKPYVVVLDGHMENGNFTNCIEPVHSFPLS